MVLAKVSPAGLKQRIEQALKPITEEDAKRITVDVEGSKVILRGMMRSWTEKREAERTAWPAPGVTSVDNQIRIPF